MRSHSLSVAPGKRRTCFLALLGLTLVLAANAQAAPYEWDLIGQQGPGPTIQDLLDENGGQILVGDKLFTFTDESVISVTSGGAAAPDAAGITLAGFQSLDDELGLCFEGAWSAPQAATANTTIRFTVEVTDPDLLIHDNTLWFDEGQAGNDGPDGIVLITENVYASDPQAIPPGDLLAAKFVYFRDDADQIPLDHELFDLPDEVIGMAKVWIVKDLTVTGGADNVGEAYLDGFYQTFSQVPEPATLALLGLGGLAAMSARVRRRKA